MKHDLVMHKLLEEHKWEWTVRDIYGKFEKKCSICGRIEKASINDYIGSTTTSSSGNVLTEKNLRDTYQRLKNYT